MAIPHSLISFENMKPMNRIFTVFCLSLFGASWLSAQDASGEGYLSLEKPVFWRNDDPSDDLDFWVGVWKLTWENEAGNIVGGRNNVRRILERKVILEEFNGGPDLELNGRSFTVYDEKADLWRQTWVDTNGEYMLFEGGPRAGRFVLDRVAGGDPNAGQFRMVFRDFRWNGFTWDWERSTDGGANWQSVWTIEYRRVERF